MNKLRMRKLLMVVCIVIISSLSFIGCTKEPIGDVQVEEKKREGEQVQQEKKEQEIPAEFLGEPVVISQEDHIQYIEEEWIYYLADGKIQRKKFDKGECIGEAEYVIDESGITSFQVVADQVFYMINEKEAQVINLKTGEKKMLWDGNKPDYRFTMKHSDQENVFFLREHEIESDAWFSDGIYKINTKDLEVTRLSEAIGQGDEIVYEHGGWLYINSYSGEWLEATKINVETGELQKVVEDGLIIIYKDNKIYYSKNDGEKTFIIESDLETGSEKYIFEEEGCQFPLGSNLQFLYTKVVGGWIEDQTLKIDIGGDKIDYVDSQYIETCQMPYEESLQSPYYIAQIGGDIYKVPMQMISEELLIEEVDQMQFIHQKVAPQVEFEMLQDYIEIKAYETFQLDTKMLQTGVKLYYISSDDNILKVTQGGKVLGIKPGEATISITGILDGYQRQTIEIKATVLAENGEHK